MKYGQIPGIDKKVARLVQGTINVTPETSEETFPLLDAVFEMGCNTYDTARGYGGGTNERAVGEWVNSRGIRDDVVIIGKGAHHSSERQRVTPEDITADIEKGLEEFGFDNIDIYILHRDDPSVPVGPIVECLDEHKAAGRIGAFGGSNWTHERIAEANQYAAGKGLTPFVCSSPNFSLADQLKEPWPNCISIAGPGNKDAREWYSETGMALFTWSSLAGGFFSGRFSRKDKGDPEDYFDKLVLECYCAEENFTRLDRVEELGREKGLSVPQVALAYVLSQPANIFALICARKPEEFRANMEALEAVLTPAQIAYLELESDER